MVTHLPGPARPQLSSPRQGKDASEEDLATLALRSVMTPMATAPGDVFEETLASLLALEISKRR
jgi:hypothetical protein